MNKNRVICGIIAALMAAQTYSVSAAVKVKFTNGNNTVRLGTDITGATYTDTEPKNLTIEEAVKKAISYSSTLQKLDDSNDINEINEMVTRYAWESTDDTNASLSYSISLRQLNNSLRNYDSSKSAEKAKIEYNIRRLFYGLKDIENSISLYDESIALKKREMAVYDVMLKVGKMSQVEYDAKVTEMETLVANKTNLENQLDSTTRSLNQLLGVNVNTKYNIIVDDIEYKPVYSELNISRALSLGISSNQSLKDLKNQLDVAEYTKDTYYFRNVTGATNTDKETIDSNYSQLLSGVDAAEKNLVSLINGTYDSIKNAEIQYKQNEASLKDMQATLKVMETQLALGKTTQLNVDAQKLSIAQLKAKMESAVRSHELLVRQFNDSNLLY